MSHHSLFFSSFLSTPKGHPHNFRADAESMLTSLMEGPTTNGTISMQVWKQTSRVRERWNWTYFQTEINKIKMKTAKKEWVYMWFLLLLFFNTCPRSGKVPLSLASPFNHCSQQHTRCGLGATFLRGGLSNICCIKTTIKGKMVLLYRFAPIRYHQNNQRRDGTSSQELFSSKCLSFACYTWDGVKFTYHCVGVYVSAWINSEDSSRLWLSWNMGLWAGIKAKCCWLVSLRILIHA